MDGFFVLLVFYATESTTLDSHAAPSLKQKPEPIIVAPVDTFFYTAYFFVNFGPLTTNIFRYDQPPDPRVSPMNDLPI